MRSCASRALVKSENRVIQGKFQKSGLFNHVPANVCSAKSYLLSLNRGKSGNNHRMQGVFQLLPGEIRNTEQHRYFCDSDLSNGFTNSHNLPFFNSRSQYSRRSNRVTGSPMYAAHLYLTVLRQTIPKVSHERKTWAMFDWAGPLGRTARSLRQSIYVDRFTIPLRATKIPFFQWTINPAEQSEFLESKSSQRNEISKAVFHR